MAIDETVQVCVGKHTRVFQLQPAADRPEELCASILVQKRILNLEAITAHARDVFLAGLHHLMISAGKRRVLKPTSQ